MKNNRHGQAKIWTDHAIKKMRGGLKTKAQKLIFEIALYTGERMGAIVQLKVSNVYKSDGTPSKFITFRCSTRKSTKHRKAKTRQVLVHPSLREALLNYHSPAVGYLFPSHSASGHISRRAIDLCWRNIQRANNLEGYSTHSCRRWVINQMRKKGVSVMTIAETMGMRIDTVRHYCDDDPDACKQAILSLEA